MTACGNKESETVTPDNSTTPEAVEPQPTQEATGTEETTSRDDTGVYPNATGLTEVAMGVTEDICTFKVPLNYVLAGGYYDENNEEHTIQGLNSATTTVEEALAAGSFSTGNHLAFFTMTSLDADQTMITTGMYTPDIMSWDDFKAYYTDAKEIGDESVPGLLYHVEAISGQCVAVAVKVLLGFNNYSLEHLMPKKWRNNWGACATEDDAKKRDSLLLTLGNLAIIPQALNASIRDAAWNVKKAGKGQNKPGLLLCASGLYTLHDVLQKNDWNEHEIENRAEWLLANAQNIWKI